MSFILFNLFLVVQAQNDLWSSQKFENQVITRYNQGEPVSVFNLLLFPNSNASSQNISDFQSKFNSFLDKMIKKKERGINEEKLVSQLFYQVHRKFLKKYREYSVLSDVAASGSYDCVSGTALYSILLKALQIKHKIRETDYHVYILIEGNEQNYLFESTDPLAGFVNDQEEILARIRMYAEDNGDENEKYFSVVEGGIQRSVDITQLAGLQYYNLAVESYNQRAFNHSFSYIQKSLILYPTERIKRFYNLLIETVSFKNLTSQVQ